VFQRLSLRVETGKRRQQAGMDVEDAPRKGCDKTRRQKPHVTREANQIRAPLAQYPNNPLFMFLATAPFTLNDDCLDFTFPSQRETLSVSFVAHNDGDDRIRDFSGANCVVQRQHV
jgi:hypothetical protein